MAGCYIGRNADLGVISEWKAQLLKNQNMLSAAHLSSGKCPDFGIHYNGNCSDEITLSKMSSTRHLRHACRLAQFHDHWEAEIKAFMWEKINRGIDINISSETLYWMVEGASVLRCIVTNLFKAKLKEPFVGWKVRNDTARRQCAVRESGNKLLIWYLDKKSECVAPSCGKFAFCIFFIKCV